MLNQPIESTCGAATVDRKPTSFDEFEKLLIVLYEIIASNEERLRQINGRLVGPVPADPTGSEKNQTPPGILPALHLRVEDMHNILLRTQDHINTLEKHI